MSMRPASPGHSRRVRSTPRSPRPAPARRGCTCRGHSRAIRSERAMDPFPPFGISARDRRVTSVGCVPAVGARVGARPHPPLPPTRGSVGVLGSVAGPFVPPVLDAGHDLPLHRSRGAPACRDPAPGRPAPLFERLPERALGGRFVAPAPDRDAGHRPGPVHRAPGLVPLARHLRLIPVQMPFVPGPRRATAASSHEGLAELERPLPHGLVADHDAANGRHLVHMPRGQEMPGGEPDGVADDLGRGAVTGAARIGERRCPA